MIDAYADRWALVTGASSGIGEAFARRLSALGMHLVVTARRKDRLERLAEELHTQHGTRTMVLPADLSEPQRPRRLLEEIESRGIDVELLINNAGFSLVGEAADAEIDRVQELLRLNISAVTELAYLLIPGMVGRGHGAIINLASVAAFQPVAYMPAYAASKSYVLHFSEALWAELRDKGVTVVALCPGATQTEFFDVAGAPGWLKKHSSHSPEDVVKAALRAMEKRKPSKVCGFKNYVISLMMRIATRKRAVLESMRYFRPQPKPDEPVAEPAEHRSE